MISTEIFIVKRDGKKEVFSLDKIKNAIAKAFLSVGSFATQEVIRTLLCGSKVIYAIPSETSGRPGS